MGLDMYLTNKRYIWNEDRKSLKITGLKRKKVNPKKVSYIIEEAGYWRKANAIHNWFVKNVQDGEDDCKEYWVSDDKLKELLDTVNKVLASSELIEGDVNVGTRWSKEGEEQIIEKGKVIKDPTV